MLAAVRDVLRDPLYRWEARRFWTARRYSWTALALAAFAALGAGCLVWNVWFLGQLAGLGRQAELDLPGMAILAGFYAEGSARLPLGVAAALAGALALAPERLSGQLEQFVLTPVDPWRFALARLAGRLRGFLVFWLGLGAVLAVTLVAVMLRGLPLLPGQPETGGAEAVTILQSLLGYGDLGLMLVLDVVVGTYYSARSRSVAWAVAMALLVSFLVMPAILYLPAVLLHLVVLFSVGTVGFDETAPAYVWVFQLLGAGLHTALGVLALLFWMRLARRAVEKVFLNPEGA